MRRLLLVLLIIALVAPFATIAWNQPPLMSSPGLPQRLVTYLTSNEVRSDPYSAYPERRVPEFRRPPEAVFEAAVAAAESLGWRIVAQNPERRRLQAVASTPLLGFKDDVTVSVRSGEDGAAELWVDSVSRLGTADLGANTARVVAYKAAVRERL
ncbi:DUF1499 domain-containing protein [Spiribacter halobius]|uniref:DUF1499 domain-containing protein n=1 Tax=Sediminicurvatus halobius TaxID=2182432 RepID=A0A2U2N1Z4_9GAMM|nr:DUF1499 domain-containing protein [Spiribacter halobius]PWG63206.1 hypothetical protein DEM34_09010 [Spiribacter halobius]UEX76724.1 DUF1499 domain-containing protein [Spiribacter halobius]